jgi:hypothetical protein
MFLDDRVALANGGLAFDPQPANGVTTLGITGVAFAVPIGLGAIALLAMSLSLLGLARLRRQRSTRA